MGHHHHGPHCGCPKKVVYPTKHNVVNNCSKEQVQHVHPSHTTVMNHHLIENQHVYPHSTSVGNTVNSVDTFGGAFNVPSPGFGPGTPGPGAPVAGAGMGPGVGPAAGMGPGMAPGAGMGPVVGPGTPQGPVNPGMPNANPWRK